MFKHGLFVVALVLAATTVGAQTTASKPSQGKGTTPNATPSVVPYVPAILQQRMVTLSGCLQHKEAYTLAQAAVTGQGDKAQPVQPEYVLEGMSAARLSMLVGKRVEVTGAFQTGPSNGTGAAALPRFEATNITEAEGSCK